MATAIGPAAIFRVGRSAWLADSRAGAGDDDGGSTPCRRQMLVILETIAAPSVVACEGIKNRFLDRITP
jgi:hypothetical protein